jgi:DNA-binding CsgD family transcriptional regulator
MTALDLLTPGERRAAELYAAGHAYDEIAARLSLKPSTIKTQLSVARGKLECRKQSEFRAKFERCIEEEHGSMLHDFSGEWLFRLLWSDSKTGSYRDCYATLQLLRKAPLSAYYTSQAGMDVTHILIDSPSALARGLEADEVVNPLNILLGDEQRVHAVGRSLFDVHHLTLEWFAAEGCICAATTMQLSRNTQQLRGNIGGFSVGADSYTLVDRISVTAVTRERFDAAVKLLGDSDRESRRKYIADRHPGAHVDNEALHHFLLFLAASVDNLLEYEMQARQPSLSSG